MSMHVNEYIHYDVHELAKLIKDQQVSVEEVLQCAQERLYEVNPSLNAIVTDCFEYAHQCIGKMRGNEPYYGVPLLVKDLGHAIEGIRLTEGSRFFANNLAETNSDLINKLITLGFVPFAKTNTSELGLSCVTESYLFGPCRNPFDTNRTAGGSSGGSAAAIVAGIAPIATASDGGGSIRIPAACCGLFGFKPTSGLIPSGPWVDESWSGMATGFILTRSINDAIALFKNLINPIRLNMLSRKKKKLLITELKGAFAEVPIAKECQDAVEKIKEILKNSGHRLNEVHLPLDLQAISSCAHTLIAANTYTKVKIQEQLSGRKPMINELEPITWEFYYRGKAVSAYELIIAKNKLYQLLRPLHQLLEKTDIVLTPALAQLPLLIGQLRTDEEFNNYLQKKKEFSPFTSLFNQGGLPAMTLPVMFQHHLPVSIQMGAAKGNDWLLLELAHELQSVLPKNLAPASIPGC
ncbi:TPA: amidase [Legionella pneumophila]|nr:amidase [Legionella pneumophila subsp. pascullei]HAT6917100.1 amidase [Legionella pneumophila]HAT6921211.1 amidase [Legionella pneumophila]HAT6972183.1 amidase [Legionella pneumophila]HAU3863007.1 amidase [Legionella pneumophila]